MIFRSPAAVTAADTATFPPGPAALVVAIVTLPPADTGWMIGKSLKLVRLTSLTVVTVPCRSMPAAAPFAVDASERLYVCTPAAKTLIGEFEATEIAAPVAALGASVGELNVPARLMGAAPVAAADWSVSESAYFNDTVTSLRPLGVQSRTFFQSNFVAPLVRSPPRGDVTLTVLTIEPLVSLVPVKLMESLKFQNVRVTEPVGVLAVIMAATKPGWLISSSVIMSKFGPAPSVPSAIAPPS